jgi:hypothetical protein
MIAEEVENYFHFVGNKTETLCLSCSKPDQINYIQSVHLVCHHCTINLIGQKNCDSSDLQWEMHRLYHH